MNRAIACTNLAGTIGSETLGHAIAAAKADFPAPASPTTTKQRCSFERLTTSPSVGVG